MILMIVLHNDASLGQTSKREGVCKELTFVARDTEYNNIGSCTDRGRMLDSNNY